MKMKYILIFSLFLLGCASGSKQQKMSLEKIEESSVDSLVLHPVPGMELWCSDGLSVCDSCLLILDRCQDKKLYVYRLNDFKCIANIGTVGQGPEDMIFPFFLHNNISSSNQQTIYDVNMARMKTIDIHSLLSGSKEIIKQMIFTKETTATQRQTMNGQPKQQQAQATTTMETTLRKNAKASLNQRSNKR